MTNANGLKQGLTTTQVKALQAQYGKNELTPRKKESFFHKVLHIIGEPMFLLLLVAAVIYFILGEPRDGAIMLVFVIGIISIDVIQEWKTDKTLSALRDLSAPHVRVIRDGLEQEIASVELVPGDLMLICEGVKIPADGKIVSCNDLCVDESSLTGEAEGVWKTATAEPTADYWRKDQCYAGTLVTQGNATVQVTQIGPRTEYGKIGVNVASAPEEPTPLQKQTGSLVKLCAGIAAVLFALVGVATYINIPDHMPGARLIESILSGITRDSTLKLAKYLGYETEEKPIPIDEVIQGASSGRITEAFGTGTAAVISPVNKIFFKGQEVLIGDNSIGPIARKLYDTLTGIQYGRVEDPFHWITPVP